MGMGCSSPRRPCPLYCFNCRRSTAAEPGGIWIEDSADKMRLLHFNGSYKIMKSILNGQKNITFFTLGAKNLTIPRGEGGCVAARARFIFNGLASGIRRYFCSNGLASGMRRYFCSNGSAFGTDWPLARSYALYIRHGKSSRIKLASSFENGTATRPHHLKQKNKLPDKRTFLFYRTKEQTSWQTHIPVLSNIRTNILTNINSLFFNEHKDIRNIRLNAQAGAPTRSGGQRHGATAAPLLSA